MTPPATSSVHFDKTCRELYTFTADTYQMWIGTLNKSWPTFDNRNVEWDSPTLYHFLPTAGNNPIVICIGSWPFFFFKKTHKRVKLHTVYRPLPNLITFGLLTSCQQIYLQTYVRFVYEYFKRIPLKLCVSLLRHRFNGIHVCTFPSFMIFLSIVALWLNSRQRIDIWLGPPLAPDGFHV